jgi:superfamily II DNA or RNA helicase
MYSVYIEKTNNNIATVYSDESCVHEELYDRFKVDDPSYRPNNFSKYDGKIRLYDKTTGHFDAGLLHRVLPTLKNYKVEVDKNFNNFRHITDKELHEWIDELNLPFTPHEYQFRIVRDFIKYRRLTALADTGAGKSLVIYIICRFLSEVQDGHVLVLVPRIQLVSQLYDNFKEYGWTECNRNVQQIVSGKPKNVHRPIVISTWQSLQDMGSDYFDPFTSVICDEVHGASAKKQTKIIKNCRNATDRLGLTGTLNGTELHQYQVEGLFGATRQYVETQELKDLGQASQTQIYMTTIRYPSIDNIRLSKLDYEGTIQYLLKHPGRMKYIAKLAKMRSDNNENSLVIFERVEKGLLEFKKYLEDMGVGDRVRIIEGSVKLDDRREITVDLEKDGGYILIATWGTLSTGISIKRLHNLFLASSTKGLIRVLQTLGRMLRIHEFKTVARIIDFVDDYRKSPSANCYYIEHSKERYKYYKMKKHDVKFVKAEIGESVERETYEDILRDSERRKANRSD